jgi:acetoin utilization protein AcuC
MKTAFVYSEEFMKFDYGPSHPLKVTRLGLTYELIRAYGLLSLPGCRYVEAEPSPEEDLLLFHGRDYIEALKAANSGPVSRGGWGMDIPLASHYGLGPGDNPVFKGVYDWSRLVAGASLQAASLVDSGEVDIAFSIAGGLHHAMASQASGFCYINDPVIAIRNLLNKGRRVAYIDIDAHHGDGVQEAFYDTDRVLTISIHESGRMLFPGTGFESETGRDRGIGYSVNIPMPPESDDELFIFAFDEIIPSLINRFRPDIVVSQLGVDSFYNDPLAHLNYTTNGFCEAVRKIKRLSPKWVALGGGGYEIANVARAWTLAWAIMNDVEIPDEIPAEFLERHRGKGFESGKIRDKARLLEGHEKSLARKEVERVIRFIQDNITGKIAGP